jgi:hypothetical protein
LFCPGPSSLIRPHPPHSQAHRDFTAWRLIRDAFAVRERLGDPRVVPGFHCSFLPGMPSSPTPGTPTSICSRTSMPTWPSPTDQRLGTPDPPAIRSTRASHFVASLVRFRYGLPGCSPPCTDRTGMPQPSGTFTSRLSTVRSPSPSLDITTTVTGLFCWRVLHPLEWQLASLHGQSETPNHVRSDGSFPRKRSPGAGDGCTASHCQPGLLLVAELDPIADAGAGDPGTLPDSCSATISASGRIEARIGLRMMPPFPRSPLTFRKASFPRYG